MSKATSIKMHETEWVEAMKHVPALTLEDLIPKLQDNGYIVLQYRNFKDKKPYKISAYSSALMMQDNEEKIKQIAGKRFLVQGVKNVEEIFITLK